jgi:glycerol-3-phosphate cytidylyltransferase-like family protein
MSGIEDAACHAKVLQLSNGVPIICGVMVDDKGRANQGLLVPNFQAFLATEFLFGIIAASSRSINKMRETEELNGQDLPEALTDGWPEAYLPQEVLASLLGQGMLFDDYRLLHHGLRISPEAIRTLCFAVCSGFSDENGKHYVSSPHFRLITLAYALFNDFFCQSELPILSGGKAIRGNLTKKPSDLLTGPTDHSLGSKVFGCVESVALDIEKRKIAHPDLKVVLFHGKWNSIPHPGHIFCLRDAITEMAQEYQIDQQNLIVVVICDTNQGIMVAGQIPFLNTLWRTSLMSFLPYVDYACPSGEYPHTDNDAADRHWLNVYSLLSPFAVNIAPDHFRKEVVYKRVRQVGAIPIEFPREGQWWPILPGESSPGSFEPSSRSIKDRAVSEDMLIRIIDHLLLVKHIRDQMYGPRQWFGPKGILLTNPSRSLTPGFIQPLISHPTEEQLLIFLGNQFPALKSARIPSIRDLVAGEQHRVLINVLSGGD